MEYANAVADEVVKRTTGRFWYGQNADMVRMSTTAVNVPQEAMVSCLHAINLVWRANRVQDAGMIMGTGLDKLNK